MTISKTGNGTKIKEVTVGGQPLDGYFVNHADLAAGKELVVVTE